MPFNGLLLILIGILSIMAFASQASSDKLARSTNVSLSIKPLACIVKHAGDTCNMTVTAKWQSAQPSNYCLFKNEQQVNCWQQQNFVEQQFNIELNNDVLFSLKNEFGDEVARQQVKLNNSESMTYRRRLRSEWSLF